MRKTLNMVLSLVAKANDYHDKFDLLRDYGFMPTVLTPKHRKIEIVKLFYDYITKKQRKVKEATIVLSLLHLLENITTVDI